MGKLTKSIKLDFGASKSAMTFFRYAFYRYSPCTYSWLQLELPEHGCGLVRLEWYKVNGFTLFEREILILSMMQLLPCPDNPQSTKIYIAPGPTGAHRVSPGPTRAQPGRKRLFIYISALRTVLLWSNLKSLLILRAFRADLHSEITISLVSNSSSESVIVTDSLYPTSYHSSNAIPAQFTSLCSPLWL